MKIRNKITGLLLCICCVFSLCACANNSSEKKTKIVLTNGFAKNEVFKIENLSCTRTEVMVYLINLQNQYEEVYGKEIWSRDINGVSLGDSVKNTVLANLSQIKAMNLLARQYQVNITQDERNRVEQAAAEYYQSLNSAEIESMHVTQEDIVNMYSEYANACKVYQYIIRDINPEISDDEARTITVDHIYLKTYTMDGQGTRIEYSEEDKQEIRRQAEEIRKMALLEDSDFKELVLKYSEGDKGTFSFGKGEMEPEYEEAAFNLETNEISKVVETEYGCYIIKCLSPFDKTQTDSNKTKIMKERRDEVFGEKYDAFAGELTKDLNNALWDSITLKQDDQIVTSDFFEVYAKYMKNV